MFKKINIRSLVRFFVLMLAVCCFLTACSPEDKSSKDKTPLGDISSDVSPQTLAAEQTDCWQSALLKEIYEQSGKLSISLYGQITGGALTLMLTGFAVWMSFRLLRHLGSFQEESIPETWNEIFRQLLLCTVCGLIAGSATNVMWVLNHVIFPLYYAFLEFGAAILNTALAGSSGTRSMVRSFASLIPTIWSRSMTLPRPVSTLNWKLSQKQSPYTASQFKKADYAAST